MLFTYRSIYNSVVHLMKGHVECVVDAEGAHFVLFLPCNVKQSDKSGEENGSGIWQTTGFTFYKYCQQPTCKECPGLTAQ